MFAPDACYGSTARKAGRDERAALLSAQLQGVEVQVQAKPRGATTRKAGRDERSVLLSAQLHGVEARTMLQNAAARRTPERRVHQRRGSATGSGRRLFEADGPPAEVGKRWLVDGCPQQNTDLDVEPALADADQALGEVQCCTAEFTATRTGCLSGSNTAAKVTFWEAKALCEGQGWRLCRREEIDTGNSAGACGTGCGYDGQLLWAGLNSPAPERWLIDGTAPLCLASFC